MNRKPSIPALLLIVVLGGVGLQQAAAHGPGRGMLRHQFFMMRGIPAPYQGLSNPLPATAETIAAGRALYDDTCAICHGPQGRGDGEGGKDLDPPPGDLMAMVRMPMASDAYFFWTISEGGEPIGTDMPAFRDVLAPEQRWQVIAALRAGLPPSP